MSDTSSIEWTDATWNPVVGCSRVSPGCENCYAERQAFRLAAMGQERYIGLTRKTAGGRIQWTGTTRFVPEVLAHPLKWKAPKRIFVNSMSDLFHADVTNEQIAAVFGVMAACPQHTFQILTKRPERMVEWFKWVADLIAIPSCDGEYTTRPASALLPHSATHGAPVLHPGYRYVHDHSTWPLANVWLGVSCENQETANERIPLLLQTPAAIRFVSAEPLLGPIDFASLPSVSGIGHFLDALSNAGCEDADVSTKLDWVIVGGESGPGARPCNVEWIRSIVAQCEDAKIPVFVKQLGSKPTGPWLDVDGVTRDVPRLDSRKGGDPAEWPEDLRVREMPRVSDV